MYVPGGRDTLLMSQLHILGVISKVKMSSVREYFNWYKHSNNTGSCAERAVPRVCFYAHASYYQLKNKGDTSEVLTKVFSDLRDGLLILGTIILTFRIDKVKAFT